MRRRSAPGAGERTIDVGGGSRPLAYPVIDQRVAGCGVEGENFRRLADPRDVRDATDVEDRERLWQRRGDSGVEQRSERRPFTARGDIGRAEIGNHVEPEETRQQRAVAQLPGAVLGRAMEDCMTVKPDDVDSGSRVAPQELLDSRGVKAGQLILDFGDRTDGPKDRPQPIAECLLVGDRQRRSGEYPLAAVRLDQRDIDPVERSAAHQSESAPHMRGALWPPLGTYVR